MKKRLMACLMAVCMFTTVLAPVNGTFATGAIEATEVPTEAPTEKPTEKPTEAPTEAPTEKPTEAPTEKPTEKPTEAPTEVPTEKPTEAPTAEPEVNAVSEDVEAEPTEVPATEAPATEAPATEAPATEVPATEAPVTVAPATEAPATEAPATEAPVTVAPATEAPATEAPATEVPATEAPSAEPTVEVTEGATIEPTVEPSAEPTAEPSVEPTVEPSAEPSAEPTIPVPETELSVLAITSADFAVANEDRISAKVTISGGIAPYSMRMKVNGADTQSWTEIAEAGEYGVSYAPTEFGVHSFKIIVTDALGAVATSEFEVPVAIRDDEENENDWEKDFRNVKLTGDWREDLIEIAKTQIGYRESERNFRIGYEGKVQGYTRYGDWYGSAYAEWCAMFVSFCLNYAEIPEKDFPREANCANWKELLQWKGAYEDDERKYEPQPGDLIFFNYEDENDPQHIGIVEKVTDSKVYTIEGNSAKAVRREEYKLDDESIVGYGNVTKLMDRAGVLESEETECNVVGAKAFTTGAGINLRSDATTSSDVVVKIEEADSETTVLGAKKTGDTIWYRVQYGEYVGYIRSDLVMIQENLTPDEPENTVEPSVKPEATVVPDVTATPEATVEPEETMDVPVDVPVEPSAEPTVEPGAEPTVEPNVEPTVEATEAPMDVPVDVPIEPSVEPSAEPTVEPEDVCNCVDAEGNRVCAEDCACECHVTEGETPIVECECIDAEGNRVCAEDCACECHVTEGGEPIAECECIDAEGNRVCAEDCACECHVTEGETPIVECECIDAEGNRVCAEDCACECHVTEDEAPIAECECIDAEGNRACAEDCACECHVTEDEAPTAECECIDAEGNRVCAEDCVCECHVTEDEAPIEIEYLPWQAGVVETIMSYAAEGAVNYSWQRGMADENGEMVWEEITTTNHAEVLLTTVFEDLSYSYRCVATMADETQVISDEITLIDAELVQWMNENAVTEEMLIRAMNASSLESLMVENGQLVYVRTGEVLADVDSENGEVFDHQYEVIVGYINKETMELVPAIEPEPVPDKE